MRIRIEETPETGVALTVEDDGGGNPARLKSGSGQGLLGIRERIAALGGSLAIGPSERGRGVRIAAVIPCVPVAPMGQAA